MKILSIFGTRPEAIKMAPLVAALEAEPGVTSIVCVTGQHRAMLDQVLGLFGIRPEHDLDVMVPNQTLNGLSARVLGLLDSLLGTVKPDRVLVHGDTTTAMAASLAAFHRRIPVGHVEAGLRTYDISQPWPEELNRRIVDVASDLLFAPTASARANLEGERLEGRILVTGNTVIDALRLTADRLRSDASLQAGLDARFGRLRRDRKMLLVTGHRRENFGAGFAKICSALTALSLRDDIEIVYPVHLNPNVRGPVREALASRPNIHLVEPQDYVPFVHLMQRAPDPDRFGRRAGGSAVFRQAGSRHARRHRAPGGRRGRDRAPRGNGSGAHRPRGDRAPGRRDDNRLRGLCAAWESLRRRPCLGADRLCPDGTSLQGVLAANPLSVGPRG